MHTVDTETPQLDLLQHELQQLEGSWPQGGKKDLQCKHSVLAWLQINGQGHPNPDARKPLTNQHSPRDRFFGLALSSCLYQPLRAVALEADRDGAE
jgi:hypothetical protein